MAQGIDNQVYDRQADTWWDGDTAFGSLRTALNPVRFGYYRRILRDELGVDPTGKPALDIGCGGGLLAEEFARLGCRVTGVDPSRPSIEVARRHATESGLNIHYQVGSGESMPFPNESFDIVYCCDVLEHVDDVGKVIAETARVLKSGGVFFYDTINRTFLSKLIFIKLYQEWRWTSFMPPNLHNFTMFIKPEELQRHLSKSGLANREVVGMASGANPITVIRALRAVKRGKMRLSEAAKSAKLAESKNTAVSYMGYAIKDRA